MIRILPTHRGSWNIWRLAEIAHRIRTGKSQLDLFHDSEDLHEHMEKLRHIRTDYRSEIDTADKVS